MSRRDSVVLTLYLILACVLTYPLVVQFTSHVPGSETWAFDEYSFVWGQWWLKHALFDLNLNPLVTNYVFYPLGLDLSSFTLLWSHASLGLPLLFAFGVVPATNALVLFSYVMGAFGTYLLVRYLLRDTVTDPRAATAAAFLAGIVFAFSSSRMVYAALGHYTVLATEWFPFYVLFLIKTVRSVSTRREAASADANDAAPQRLSSTAGARSWSYPLLAGLFASLSLYSDAAHGPLLVLFTLLYLAFHWRDVITRAGLVRMIVLGGLTALLYAPLLIPLLNQMLFSGYQLPGWGHAEKLLVDLAGFLAPTSLHPLARNWTVELDQVRQGTARFVDVQTVFLGYATVALALLGAIKYWKRLRIWTVSALVFATLSLGPLLHINGKSVFDLDGLAVNFPLPFILVHYIPFLKENRVPNRYSILVVLSLAVLAGFVVAWLLGRIGRGVRGARKGQAGLRGVLQWAVYGLILGAVVVEHLALPLPMTDARVPAVYEQIAQDEGSFAILSLPLGWRNSFTTQGAEDTRTQYYQSVHGKYLLSGNASRNPPWLFEYFDRVPLFNSLSQIELYQELSPETLARDKAEAASIMSFFDIRYVVINAAVPGRPPYSDTRGAVLDYIQQVLPLGDKIYDADSIIAYRVNQGPAPERVQVNLGTDVAHLYEAEGWDRDEVIGGQQANWANARAARILFPVQEIADYQVSLTALPFTYPQAPAQTMELVVNGQAIQKFELGASWQDYTATIPAQALRTGLNDLVLRFGYLVSPKDVLPADYQIGSTGVKSRVNLVVNSAELGSIKVNGREVSVLGDGYNVVVIDPQSGAVREARSFDTGSDIAQSRAMTDFLGRVPQGSIVAVAAQGDAMSNLGERTVNELRGLGAAIDLRTRPGSSHALIGVKGAATGTALEQANEGGSFISVGQSPDERTLAAAVSRVTIEPANAR